MAYKGVVNGKLSESARQDILKGLANNYWDKYLNIAMEVIKGKYGNGKTRQDKLTALGYDYDITQAIVNYLLK